MLPFTGWLATASVSRPAIYWQSKTRFRESGRRWAPAWVASGLRRTRSPKISPPRARFTSCGTSTLFSAGSGVHFGASRSVSHNSPSCRSRARLKGQALVAAHFHDRKPVRRSQLAQHAMHMVLHGLFGEVQSAGHLFVRKPLLHQAHQLLLPAAEAEAGLQMQARNGWLIPLNPLK